MTVMFDWNDIYISLLLRIKTNIFLLRVCAIEANEMSSNFNVPISEAEKITISHIWFTNVRRTMQHVRLYLENTAN